MKPYSGVSAFADRNYCPDAKVGADEEGDVSANDDDETGNDEIRSGRRRAARSWDDRRARSTRTRSRGRSARTIQFLDGGGRQSSAPPPTCGNGDHTLAARSTSIGCHRDTSFGGRCKIIFA